MKKSLEKEIKSFKMLWAITDASDWPQTDYSVFKSFLLNKMDLQQIKKLESEFFYVKEILYDKISIKMAHNVGASIGSESGDDLISHVIGKGCKFTLDIINNEFEAWANIKKNGFVESFSYCIPLPSDLDVKMTNIEYATANLKDLELKITVIDDSPEITDFYKNEVKKDILPFLELMKQVEDQSIENIDIKKLNKQIVEINEKHKISFVILENSKKFENSSLLNYSYTNIAMDMIEDKKAESLSGNFEISFDEFGKKYIQSFNQKKLAKP